MGPRGGADAVPSQHLDPVGPHEPRPHPDPNNVDDAALTAGAYLCADGRNLSTATGWRAGIGSYNALEAYNVLVTAAANRYAQASLA